MRYCLPGPQQFSDLEPSIAFQAVVDDSLFTDSELNINCIENKEKKKSLTNKILTSSMRLTEAFLKDQFLFSAGPAADVC